MQKALAVIFFFALLSAPALAFDVWGWQLLDPVAPELSQTTYHFAISGQSPTLFLSIDANLTYSVLIEFGNQSRLFPSTSDFTNVSIALDNDLWTIPSIKVSLLDSMNTTTNYSGSTDFKRNDWGFAYSIMVSQPIDSWSWCLTESESVTLGCTWDVAGEHISYPLPVSQNDGDMNIFSCDFQFADYPDTPAGTPVDMTISMSYFDDQTSKFAQKKMQGNGKIAA